MRIGGSAAEIIDDEVRELIRRRGVDPFLDAGRIRSLVREVVLDYEDRAASEDGLVREESAGQPKTVDGSKLYGAS